MSTTIATSTHAAPTFSASGLLSMLLEPSPALRKAALRKLLDIVDTNWHEVAQSLSDLEGIADDVEEPLETRQIAAAVASHVFFHLEEPGQALRLALQSENGVFDIKGSKNKQYVECLVSAAIDAYVAKKKAEHLGEDTNEENAGELDMDKLRAVVQYMFEKCFEKGDFNYALGVALEAMDLKNVRQVLNTGAKQSDIFGWYQLCKDSMKAATLISSKKFRHEVVGEIMQQLKLIVSSVTAVQKEASVSLSHCYQILNQPGPVGEIIITLLKGDDEGEFLLGYQLCFDLIESGDQNFVNQVQQTLPEKGEESVTLSDEHWTHLESAKRILSGGLASELALSFMHKNTNSDTLIMQNLKKALEERGSSRNSLLHNCAVLTHSYLNAGTTNDAFLRDNLEWMKKASNWAKFSATASLGVVHAGHITEAMHLLEPYLPETPNAENPDANPVSAEGGYAEGGSLYALGLIHGSNVGSSSAKREEANSFLRGHLRNSHANEAISHGSALGVGLTALGTNNIEVVNELKELLYTDSAVAGEGAGIAIGMVLVGSGAGNVNNSVDPQDAQEIADIIFELKNYAKETQHEKIIRGIVMGLALINFGQEENADTMIDEMRSDRDPLLRYGAQYTLALAYCGTGSNKAIRLLLHTAVSDVSDDVRMAAVIGLAFVLYKTPDRVPQLVKLLLESFNPHVRYASCMAVGMAMAGTGDSESVAMLEPMLTDMSDFVRQGALMGTALIYMQQADSCNSKKIKLFREKLSSLLTSKHQTSLTKMGAILSTGIIDAGGRNCSFDLGSKNGFTKMNTAVGAALWLQHWYWYPMMHMFSLAITPTFTIALNKDFKYPKNFEIECNSKPSTFAYPKHLEEKKEVEKKRVETVTLSITAKNNARLARKKAKEEGDDTPMEDVKEEKIDKEKSEGKEGEAMEIDGEEGKKPKKKKEPEPKSFTLSNPCRITKAQANVCSFGQSQRYYPVRSEEKPRGVILVTDSRPGEEEDLGTVKPPSIESEDEPDAPEPFVWTPPGYTEPIPEEEDSSPATE